MDTRADRDQEARQHRARWSAAVLQALEAAGLSIHAAARLAGINPAALYGWLHNDLEPNPRKLGPLAKVIGLPHAAQLDLLGWLPEASEQRGDWRQH